MKCSVQFKSESMIADRNPRHKREEKAPTYTRAKRAFVNLLLSWHSSPVCRISRKEITRRSIAYSVFKSTRARSRRPSDSSALASCVWTPRCYDVVFGKLLETWRRAGCGVGRGTAGRTRGPKDNFGNPRNFFFGLENEFAYRVWYGEELQLLGLEIEPLLQGRERCHTIP